MRSSSRTALCVLIIVAAAALLAFFFNQWRPTPLAWVRTEAFVPAPTPAPATISSESAQSGPQEEPSTSAAETTVTPAADIPAQTPREVDTSSHAEPAPAMEAPAPMSQDASQTQPTEEQPSDPTATEAPIQPEEATHRAPADVPATSHEIELTPPQGPEKVSVVDALQLHLSGQAVFLDARDPDTYAQGHIPGALCVPPTELDRLWPQIAPHMEGKTVVTYCDGELCPLSQELADALLARGVTTVLVFVNGWSLWQDEHLPTTTGLNP